MTDAAVSLAIFLAICIGLAFLLWGLSVWDERSKRRDWIRATRLAATLMKRRHPDFNLDEEAANAEHGVTKFRGRHYDAA